VTADGTIVTGDENGRKERDFSFLFGFVRAGPTQREKKKKGSARKKREEQTENRAGEPLTLI
jgi:hypothetical protein